MSFQIATKELISTFTNYCSSHVYRLGTVRMIFYDPVCLLN